MLALRRYFDYKQTWNFRGATRIQDLARTVLLLVHTAPDVCESRNWENMSWLVAIFLLFVCAQLCIEAE